MDAVQYGSITKEHQIDDNGSTVTTEISTTQGVVQPVKLIYKVRHRINKPSDEAYVYQKFDERHQRYPLFDSGITFEKKNRLNKTGSYYMVEHFTMYRTPKDGRHIENFINVEKQELGL